MRLSLRLVLGFLALLLAGGGTAGGLLVTEPWAGPGRELYLVRTDAPTALALEAGLEPLYVFDRAMSGFAAEMTEPQADALAEQPGVDVVRDPGVRIADTLPTGIDRIDGDRYWGQEDGTDVTGRGGRGTTVAVIDTGVGPTDDLAINEVLSKDFTGAGTWQDGHGHGTHVAGIIAASDNDALVIGVAPQAEIASLRVLESDGWGTFAGVIAGIEWAIQHADEIDVVNLSLGSHMRDETTCDEPSIIHEPFCAAIEAGLVIVAAAGNSNMDALGFVPAAWPETLAVSALADSDGEPGAVGPDTSRGPDDTLAEFSNWGSRIDLAAPGVDIDSLRVGGGLRSMSGTSMAAPHVAGLAALWIESFGKPPDARGVQWLYSDLVDRGAPQKSPCGMTGDRDAYPEPVAQAVQREDCGGASPEPTPSPTPTATPDPGLPPSDVTVRTECAGDEVNVIISWQDNSKTESWFGVFLDDGSWQGSTLGTRFLWAGAEVGETRQAIVGAYAGGYRWSPWVEFAVQCPEVPPDPTPEPSCRDLERLRELACEGFGILFPDAEVCR